MSKPVEIEETNFDEMVLKAEKPVLVDFGAPWCGPCRMIEPIVDELAGEYAGRVAFFKVNVDENQGIASKYSIMGMPTLILFKDGKPVTNIIGFKPKGELKKSLDHAL